MFNGADDASFGRRFSVVITGRADNAHNQAHDANNLFITDGACMASSSCVNPSLTYMALTARACDYAVSQMKQGAI